MIRQELRNDKHRVMLSRGTFRKTAAVAAMLLGVEIATASSGALSSFASIALNKAWEVAAVLAAFVAWFWSARQHTGAECRWRYWMSAAMAVFLIGLGTWAWGQVIANVPLPTRTLGPAGFLLTPILVLLALILRAYDQTPERPPLGGQRNRLVRVLDVAIIAVSVLLFVIVTLGEQLSRNWHTSGPILTLLAAYPLTYLFLAAGIVVLTRFRPVTRNLPALLIGLAATSYVISSLLFAHVVELGLTSVPPWVEVGFMACPVLFFLAALAPTNRGAEHRVRPSAWEIAQLAVPYLPLIATTVFIALELAAGLTLTRQQEFIYLVLFCMVIGRQITTLADNNRLFRQKEHDALHDPLTGLANRTLFLHRLEVARQRQSTSTALVFCDMDDFKEINDTFGHPTGDVVLRSTGNRLERCVQHGDTVARIGGDEFAILLGSQSGSFDDMSQRLLAALQEPHLIGGVFRVVSASVGITRLTPNEPKLNTEELLRHADTAMYKAKQRGKNTLVRIPERQEEPV